METTKTVVLKKSELAMLKGSGHTHEMVAAKFGVKESEIKDAMMRFNLSKAKPKTKKDPIYVIQLENDMDDAPLLGTATIEGPVASEKKEDVKAGSGAITETVDPKQQSIEL
jgi:hypothetical protein